MRSEGISRMLLADCVVPHEEAGLRQDLATGGCVTRKNWAG